VAGCVQLLQQQYKDKLDERADQFINFAVDGASRMQTMINDLLAFSRVRRAEGSREVADANAALETALKNLVAAVAETNAVITRDPLPFVAADAGLLSTLFQNLIANGIKFRKADTKPHIHISVAIRNERALFSVKDDGIGISPEFHDRIFGIFQRLHSRQEYPGTGIGLAICKKIVEQHGGTLWVESVLGHGAAFYFDLALNSKSAENV
jgi:light-regulated signal transduction histidine kinase (bacteriophytochrome)